MRNITHLLNNIYLPRKALVIYNKMDDDSHYVESFDINENGKPINAHPLSVQESIHLSKALHPKEETGNNFLQHAGLLPENLLYLKQGENGCALWFTTPKKTALFFKPELGIPSGDAEIPSLLWKADKEKLYIFALTGNKRPTEKTPLCHAPFFNIHSDGNVCMGTVDIALLHDCSLTNFMKQWEAYFFNSYFSHLLDNYNPVSGNIVQLWKKLINTKQKFPAEVLVKSKYTIKNILP